MTNAWLAEASICPKIKREHLSSNIVPSAEERIFPRAPTGKRAGDAGGNRTADRSGVDSNSNREGRIGIFNKQ